MKTLTARRFSALALALTTLLAACASPTPQVVEVTRLVPEVFIVTVVVTQPAPTAASTTPIPPTLTPTLDPNAPDPRLWYPLLNCPPSRLRRDKIARVSLVGDHNAIRAEPDVHDPGNIVGYAEPGEKMTIVGGPVCNWNWVLWQVKTELGIQGWTPEGDGVTWWLEPVN
jgi:hypothetical protein